MYQTQNFTHFPLRLCIQMMVKKAQYKYAQSHKNTNKNKQKYTFVTVKLHVRK